MGITNDSISKLAEEGFTSMETLEVLQIDDLEIFGINLLGQRCLLERFINRKHQQDPSVQHLQPSGQPMLLQGQPLQPQGQPLQQPLQPPQHPLSQLLQPAMASSITQGERVGLNPLSNLLPKQTPKFLDLVDFVGGGATWGVWTGDIRGRGWDPSGHKIWPKEALAAECQSTSWVSGKYKYLTWIAEAGQLTAAGSVDYLAYTVKIHELADAYMWPTVFSFDRAYRQMQAKYRFRWGSNSPYLARFHLRPRQATGPAKTPSQGGNKGKLQYVGCTIRGSAPLEPSVEIATSAWPPTARNHTH